MESTYTTNMEVVVRWISADDKVSQAEVVFTSIKMSQKATTGPMEFDSSLPADQDPDNALASAFRPLIGVPIKVRLDSVGKVLDAKLAGNVPAASSQGTNYRNSLIEKTQVQNKFGSIFSTGNPSEKVPVGSSWTSKSAMVLGPGSVINVTSKHTLEAVNGADATIKISGAADAKPDTGGGAKIKSQEAHIDRVSTWDTATGTLRQLDTDQSGSLEVENSNASVKVALRAKVTLKRIDQPATEAPSRTTPK
jgi:hypothetical protein